MFQFINSLSRCARSERFTVSCSMHTTWCVEAIVYFRIVHCTAIPRWPRLRRASIHVGGRGTPCIPIMTWHNCIHHALRSTQWSIHVQRRPAQFSFKVLLLGLNGLSRTSPNHPTTTFHHTLYINKQALYTPHVENSPFNSEKII